MPPTSCNEHDMDGEKYWKKLLLHKKTMELALAKQIELKVCTSTNKPLLSQLKI